MSGMVFHPGHHELHGVTVVVDLTDGRTLVGRFDREDERGAILLGLTTWAPDSGRTREEFLARIHKFGLVPEVRHLIVPTAEITSITPLGAA